MYREKEREKRDSYRYKVEKKKVIKVIYNFIQLTKFNPVDKVE